MPSALPDICSVNLGMQSFTYGKYLGTVLEKVWSGHAKIPARPRLWEEFWEGVEKRGGLKAGYQWFDKETIDGQLRTRLCRSQNWRLQVAQNI